MILRKRNNMRNNLIILYVRSILAAYKESILGPLDKAQDWKRNELKNAAMTESRNEPSSSCKNPEVQKNRGKRTARTTARAE